MYLVSACLAGVKCRYDGNSNLNEEVVRLVNEGKAIPICPEQLGGLTTPRIPSEIIMGSEGSSVVFNKQGKEVTEAFKKGAERTLAVAKTLGVKKAILKAKSPSCGCGKIYDGTFSGKLIDGNGVTAALLLQEGIEVCTEQDF